MLIAVNARTLPDQADTDRLRAAGIGGVELLIADEGRLTFETPLVDCRELANRAASLNLKITSLATQAFWEVNYADPDERRRRRAIDITMSMLERAAVLGAAAVLVMPAVVGLDDDMRPRVAYSDALSRSFEALCGLRESAEAFGVTIAVVNASNRFLLSPAEFADLIDRVNSAYVGVGLDVEAVMRIGYPADWIHTLGGRLKCVHVENRDCMAPGDTVRDALRRAGYEGPVVYVGRNDPLEAVGGWKG